MDNFEEHGLVLSEVVACGGIAERSPLMMQLLADTSGRRVHVPEVSEIPARGAALFGAVAAGVFDDIGRGDRGHPPASGAHLRARLGGEERPTTGVYEIYRTLYEFLGRSEVAAAARPEANRHGKERSVSRASPGSDCSGSCRSSTTT